MPRKPRMYLGGMPYHIIQRGNNRSACFCSKADYRSYLDQLRDACRRYQVQLHAYVLMTNHSHLLMTPSDESGISRVMQSLGRRYVQYFNKTYHRTGTLWESRHRSSLVDTDNYLLACYRYIELNPVRAGMVDLPDNYEWSSFRSNAQGIPDDTLTPHPNYLSLGDSEEERQSHYRALFNDQLAENVVSEIRQAISFC